MASLPEFDEFSLTFGWAARHRPVWAKAQVPINRVARECHSDIKYQPDWEYSSVPSSTRTGCPEPPSAVGNPDHRPAVPLRSANWHPACDRSPGPASSPYGG